MELVFPTETNPSKIHFVEIPVNSLNKLFFGFDAYAPQERTGHFAEKDLDQIEPVETSRVAFMVK
jgi:hypothetical protein